MKNYIETLNYIHSLGMYSNPPHTDLSKIKYLCGIFGNPQDSYKTVHVAGTNGKGSTVAMLFNIIKELGYKKTGRFISPYIEKFTERISFGESDISEEDIVHYACRIRKTLEEKNISREYMPNEFEFITLLAFLYYKEKDCEIAVIETGLGGMLDPTNIIKAPLASVITSISLDHMQVLGDTVEKIAVYKCGIIKENSKVVLYPFNSDSIKEIVKDKAREKNSDLIMPDVNSLKITEENINFTEFEYKGRVYKTKLLGRHQVYNAVTVIETIYNIFEPVKIKEEDLYRAVYNGIENTFFQSRFEILLKKPLVIFDGAHNISGITALKETIKNLMPDKKIVLLCGMLKDKNPEEILKEICAEPFVYKFIAVPVNSPRSDKPENLRDYALKYCENAEHNYNLKDALKKALGYASEFDDNNNNCEDCAVVCFGSFYFAGDIKNALYK